MLAKAPFFDLEKNKRLMEELEKLTQITKK